MKRSFIKFVTLLNTDNTFRSLYEGESGTEGAAGGTTNGGTQQNTGTQQNAGAVKIEETPEFKATLNRELNRVAADKKRENQKLVQELTTLRENSQLTEAEKNKLQEQIDHLTSTFQSKEEQAKIEIDKLKKDYGKQIEGEKSRGDKYQALYENKLKSVEIFNAAEKFKAFRGEQIEAILLPITKVVETVGEDGKPTGQFAPEVSFTGKDKDGKPVQLKLSVHDAVKAMSEWPEQYGNLFKNEATSGLNLNTNGGSVDNGRIPDLDSMSLEQYKKNRDKIIASAR